MNHRIFAAALVFSALLLAACGAPAPTAMPTPAPTATPTPAATATPVPPAATGSDASAQPTPAPTGAPAAGLAPGTFAAAYGDVYYCVKVNRIVRLDKATLAETALREYGDEYVIYMVFTDPSGALYYIRGISGSDDFANTLFRYDAAGDVPLVDNIAFVLGVAGDEIMYLDAKGQICRLATASGRVTETGFAGFDLTVPLPFAGALPGVIVRKYTESGGYTLCRYNVGANTLDELPGVEATHIASDDGRYLLQFAFDERNIVSRASLFDAEAWKPVFEDLDLGKLGCVNVNAALVRDGKLYLVTEGVSDYRLRRVDLGTLAVEDVLTIENAGFYGNMRTHALGDGRWLMYYETVTRGTAEDPKEKTPKVAVYTLGGSALAYAGAFEPVVFDPVRAVGVDVAGDRLFLCEDYTIFSPNTGEYNYFKTLDLSGVQ